jgi:hypothetical protein
MQTYVKVTTIESSWSYNSHNTLVSDYVYHMIISLLHEFFTSSTTFKCDSNIETYRVMALMCYLDNHNKPTHPNIVFSMYHFRHFGERFSVLSGTCLYAHRYVPAELFII